MEVGPFVLAVPCGPSRPSGPANNAPVKPERVYSSAMMVHVKLVTRTVT